MSFTRAAAVEIAGRDLPIPDEHVGTIHALCYRAIGRPTIAETRLAEWNTQHANSYRLNVRTKGTLDEPSGNYGELGRGDDLLRQYQVLRARMAPRAGWPASVAAFAQRWESWKRDTGYVDFTDLLTTALEDVDHAPGNPHVITLDESQDCTPLQWALIRKWARHCDTLVAVGDADQILYHWMGASPEPMMIPLPEDRKIVLQHSYRVPHAVHAVSQKWIRQISNREDVAYLPRDAEGEVVCKNNIRWRNPTTELLRDIDAELSLGQSVMILASCSYMLAPTIKMLRSAGYPYHNPYRYSRGDWNPLRASRGTSVSDRLLAYLRPDRSVWGEYSRMWTYDDLEDFVGILRTDGVLKRGAKTKLRSMGEDEKRSEVSLGWLLSDVFEEDALNHAFEADLRWFGDNVLASKRQVAEYPLTVALKRGGQVLREQPSIIVGTIHSVKGGEASVVYLYPDLSRAGANQWVASGEGRDSVIRMFYVGMTRAREKLVLCGHSQSSPAGCHVSIAV